MKTKLPDSENGIQKNRAPDREKQRELAPSKLVKKSTAMETQVIYIDEQRLKTVTIVIFVFTTRRYASAVYAVVVCLCVCVCHTPVFYQNG